MHIQDVTEFLVNRVFRRRRDAEKKNTDARFSGNHQTAKVVVSCNQNTVSLSSLFQKLHIGGSRLSDVGC